jgi:hypothetical protein
MSHSTKTRLSRMFYELLVEVERLDSELLQCARASARARGALRNARESLPEEHRKQFDAVYQHWMGDAPARKA